MSCIAFYDPTVDMLNFELPQFLPQHFMNQITEIRYSDSVLAKGEKTFFVLTRLRYVRCLLFRKVLWKLAKRKTRDH